MNDGSYLLGEAGEGQFWAKWKLKEKGFTTRKGDMLKQFLRATLICSCWNNFGEFSVDTLEAWAFKRVLKEFWEILLIVLWKLGTVLMWSSKLMCRSQRRKSRGSEVQWYPRPALRRPPLPFHDWSSCCVNHKCRFQEIEVCTIVVTYIYSNELIIKLINFVLYKCKFDNLL